MPEFLSTPDRLSQQAARDAGIDALTMEKIEARREIRRDYGLQLGDGGHHNPDYLADDRRRYEKKYGEVFPENWFLYHQYDPDSIPPEWPPSWHRREPSYPIIVPKPRPS